MFADIHTHILPGLDDGADNGAESLQMLEMAYFDGIRHLVVTPHFTPNEDHNSGGATVDMGAGRNTSDIVFQRTMELIRTAREHNIDINLYPGTEVLLHPDIPSMLDAGSICTINGTRYVLVEFPLSYIPMYAGNVLYQIQLKGFIPIIAHPERYVEVIKNPGILNDIIGSGMLLQVNAGSLTGKYGRRVKKTAIRLIKTGRVYFVASDAHNCTGRTPELSRAAGVASRKFGSDMAEYLFYKNAMAVLEGGNIPDRMDMKRRFGLFSLIFGRFVRRHGYGRGLNCKSIN